jgi:hypothetical protein
MKIIYGLAALLSFHVASAASPAATAGAGDAATAVGGFQISPRVGKTTLHLNSGVVRSGTEADYETLLGGVALSYTMAAGPLAEFGYGSQGNWSFFGLEDRYRLREYSLAAGYRISTPRGFVITPKLGRSRWELLAQDSVFTRADSGQPNTMRGYENFWELSLQKKIRDAAALGVTFKENHYDFGKARTIAFTATFNL